MTTLEELRARRDALPPPHEATGARAQESLWLEARVLDARIASAQVTSQVMADLDAEIEPRLTWRDRLVEWRRELAAQLLASPPRATTRQEQDARRGLEISITAIDRGFNFAGETYPPNLPLFTLLAEAGYVARPEQSWNPWSGGFGALPAVTNRLAELQQRRDEAQRRLELTLADTVTA